MGDLTQKAHFARGDRKRPGGYGCCGASCDNATNATSPAPGLRRRGRPVGRGLAERGLLMAAVAADRHLLLGLLALQTGLIQQAQLVAAFHAWTCDRSRSLADHLVAQGHLNAAQRAAVEALA